MLVTRNQVIAKLLCGLLLVSSAFSCVTESKTTDDKLSRDEIAGIVSICLDRLIEEIPNARDYIVSFDLMTFTSWEAQPAFIIVAEHSAPRISRTHLHCRGSVKEPDKLVSSYYIADVASKADDGRYLPAGSSDDSPQFQYEVFKVDSLLKDK